MVAFKFTVQKAPRTYDTNCILNITGRQPSVRYRSFVADNAAAVAYVQGGSIDSDSSLSIFDRSTSLFENREYRADIVTKENVQSYLATTGEVVITDVFTTINTGKNVPLFYKHVLSTTNVPRSSTATYALDTNVEIVDIKLLDNTLTEVAVEETSFDLTKGIVYSNIEHEYDAETNDYKIYYISYTVRNGSAIRSFTEIYNAQPTYTLATIDDIDTSTMLLYTDGRKVYTMDETGGSFLFTMPTNSDYGFKISTNSRIKLEEPINKDMNSPWFVKATNGSFRKNLFGIGYKYYVSEFDSQDFNPYSPYKYASLEDEEILARNLIKLDNAPVFVDESNGYHLTILVADENGDGKAALTTNSALNGTTASNGATYGYWSATSRVGIRSIDKKYGFVDVEGVQLREDYTVQATYYYEEEAYEITAIDFNPINNSTLLDKRVAFFVQPEVFGGTPRTQSVYYMKIDEVGKVYESNWTGFNNTLQRVSTTGNELYYDEKPSFKQITVSGLNNYIHPDAEIFLDRYATTSGTLTSNIFLPLGEVAITRPFGLDQLSIVDARVNGGGIKENQLVAAEETQEEVAWYTNYGYWDGIPYPGNSSFYVEVPTSVLDDAGGTFSQNEVKSVIYKHCSLGAYPVVHTYGIDVTISGILPRFDSVRFNWDTHSGVYYDIYYSQTEDGPWTQHNTTRVFDNQPFINQYTVSGLNPGTEYWVHVVPGYVTGDGSYHTQSSQFVGEFDRGSTLFGRTNRFKIKTVRLG